MQELIVSKEELVELFMSDKIIDTGKGWFMDDNFVDIIALHEVEPKFLQDLANAVNYALEQQGMPKRTLEEVRQFVGNGVRLLMIRAVPDGESNPLFEETFALFKEYYGKHCNDNTKPYAGVVELIET